MPAVAPSTVGLPDFTETGRLGVCHLKRYWTRMMAARSGRTIPAGPEERQFDRMLLDALGVGIGQVMSRLYRQDGDFAAFEDWIESTAGGLDATAVGRFNAIVCGEPAPVAVQREFAEIEAMADVLSSDEIAHWEREGYVVLRAAIDAATSAAAAQVIWDAIGGRADEPDSWYRPREEGGITLEIYQHAVATAIRRSLRIRKAYAQLWGTPDLWTTMDRFGFNPPIRPGYAGSVQKLHWDVSLARPIPFGTQGMLYLTGNPPEQGAFRLVPGFHRHLDEWLDGLPAGAIPGQQDLEALGTVPVPGRAGDLVIWSHHLPHGPSENRGRHPRMVLYLNLYASAYRAQAEWL